MRVCLILCTVAIALCGCMHTSTGGNPTPSPDNRYAIATRAHGASGKAYVAKTKKRFYVWIGPKETDNPVRPLKKKYVFVASRLSWRVNWQGSEQVAVDLFDYGDGVSSGEARRAGAPSNHIASLLFRKMPDGRFVEAR